MWISASPYSITSDICPTAKGSWYYGRLHPMGGSIHHSVFRIRKEQLWGRHSATVFDTSHQTKALVVPQGMSCEFYNLTDLTTNARNQLQESSVDVPMVFVGNKIDQIGDRMVSTQEGMWQARFGSCVCFHEISVRESTEQVTRVFRDTCRFWRVLNRYPKLRRSTSDVQDLYSEVSLISSHTSDLRHEKRRSITIIGD